MKVVLCLVVAMFFYTFYGSIEKWHSGRTSFASNVIEVERILYPSITVCKKYALNSNEVMSKLFADVSLEEKKKLVLENMWNITDVFHFMNHPGMFGLVFPCVTADDGTDPGKPCSFPFHSM